ncbi:MAG: F0F1 ATP synthase subunit A [Candidatus Bipolaricaulota bacterium]|nr:F0F1 ATP synthase subunit A [Candidatus Bipolaricaulota bacterium]
MSSEIGRDLVWRVPVGPWAIALNPLTLAAALGVALGLVLLGLWLRRGIPADPEAPPSRRLVLLTAFLEFVERQILGAMEEGIKRALLPFVATLFLFVLASNLAPLLPLPGLVAPTRDLNVTLGLALLVYALCHLYGIRAKGLWRHGKSYLEPLPVMLPMNLVGDLGRTLSHAFRLFGNILGGSIMLAVIFPVLVDLVLRFRWILGVFLLLVGALALRALARRGKARAFRVLGLLWLGALALFVVHIWVPLVWAAPAAFLVGTGAGVILNFFFGVFSGTIQALVFTLLAAAYIQMAVE